LFDFASFDALYLVAAMPSLASTVIDDVPLRLDGEGIHSWAWLATGSLQRLPFVAVHETGHLLGLPDLYNERVPSSQHNWDVMTAAPSGGGMFAWHRWKLG
jgi:M6 family metalloprotease-like protein